jgi:hypothetical protein
MAIFGGHKASVKVNPFLGQGKCKMRSPFHAFKPLGCALCATAPRGAVSDVVLDVHSDLGLSLDGGQIVCHANKQVTSRKLGGGGSNGQATKKNR